MYAIVMDCFIGIGSTYINTIQLKIQMLNKGNGVSNRIEMLKEIEKKKVNRKTKKKYQELKKSIKS